MHFQTKIKKQAAKAIPLPIFPNRSEAASNLQKTARTIKKSELSEEVAIAAINQNKTSHEIPTPYPSERLLIQSSGELEGKEQSHLTPEERKVVGDISRLFNSEASKPAKLLIRLNQTQCSKAGRSSENGAVENRLEKIEITRLDEQNRLNITDFIKPATESPGSQGLNPPKAHENEQDLSSIPSSINIVHNESLLQTHRERMATSKQVSIMYVPDLNISTLIGMKNPPQLFNKFTRKAVDKCMDSIGSNFSQDFADKKQQPSTFVKLLEIDLFMKRNEVQQHRLEQLRLANEKMLASHLIDKENLEQYRKYAEKIEQSFTKNTEEMRKQVEEQKGINGQLLLEIENKEKAIASAKKLNEQYLKENNELKQKLKEYIKHIHELKAEISNKERPKFDENMNKNNPAATNEKRIVASKIFLEQHRNSNDYGHYQVPKSPRKQVTFNQLEQEPATNYQFYAINPYYPSELNEKMVYDYSKLERQRNEPKLSNCRSQGMLTRPQPTSNETSGKKQAEPASWSQKGVGIRRNNLNQQPISPSTRNLVRVNKNMANDGSILLGDKLRDNKSLSSYSNLSGKSLSQRVGFISKPPPADKSKGMLVDYMIQAPPTDRVEEKEKGVAQRFKLKSRNQ